ncbi:MAG: hypothetical protein K2Y16_06245 [Burkholderiales bacterium]|nr:hypothetical protein [Burkholderiales bacterium]
MIAATDQENNLALVRCKKCWLEVRAETVTCPRCGARVREPVSQVALALGALLIVFGLITFHRYGGPGGNAPPPKSDPAAEAKAEAISNLDFSFSWTKGKPGSVMFIDITLTNTGARDVKDLVIVCEHILDSGIVPVKNRSILYETIKASETKTFPRFNMGYLPGDTPTTRCHVEDLIVL